MFWTATVQFKTCDWNICNTYWNVEGTHLQPLSLSAMYLPVLYKTSPIILPTGVCQHFSLPSCTYRPRTLQNCRICDRSAQNCWGFNRDDWFTSDALRLLLCKCAQKVWEVCMVRLSIRILHLHFLYIIVFATATTRKERYRLCRF